MDSSVKGGIEIKTDRHSHSGKCPRIEDSPICSDEIETQKLVPHHSGKRRRLENNTIRSDDDDHKQIETHKGKGGKTTHRKSVKQKAPACPKCRRRRDRARARAKTEKPPLPEGCGYLCLESGVDADGHYYEVLSNLVGYMSCLRCGMDGDHWDAYCPNPINDPPESEETAAARLSWKYILRDFNPKQQIDKEIETRKGPKSPDRASITSLVKGGTKIKTEANRHSDERPRLEDTTIHSDDLLAACDIEIESHKGGVSKTAHRKLVNQKAPVCPKCRRRRRRDLARAKTEKPPLPDGCGYLCLESGVDADGRYYEVLSDLVGYMSCLRCGTDGDHWDPYCPNPINDPPESEETAAARLSWKYTLRDFNKKSH